MPEHEYDRILHAVRDIGLASDQEPARRRVLARLDARLQDTAPKERQRRSTLPRYRFKLVATTAVGVLALGGVAAGAATLWAPQLGDSHRGHPTATATPPPADELADLSVLRRAATDADRGAQSQYALKLFDRDMHGVRLDSVRLLGTQDGGGYVLVPVASYHRPDGTGSIDDALCLFARMRGGGGVGCWTLQQVRAGQAVMGVDAPSSGAPAATPPPTTSDVHTDARGSHYGEMTAPSDTGEGRRQFGLVPDGVAEVRADDGAVRATVHDNFFTLTLPANASSIVPDLHWYDAAGNEVHHSAD